MFNKKRSLFLITLAFMLSISAVAAADLNSTDDMTAGDVEEEPPSGSDMELSQDDQDNLAASKPAYELTSSDVTMYYLNGTSYEVTLSQGGNPISNATVTISVNGKDYARNTNANGVAKLQIGLKPNQYTISATYDGLKTTNTLKVLPVVSGKDVSAYYGNSIVYTATFLNNQGKALANTNVQFTINGVTYTRKTDSNGVATMPIGLRAGSYVINAIHPNGYKISNKINVKTTVTASDFTKYYGGSSKFSAKFLDKKGNVLKNRQIKFIAHGNTFTATTNSNGVAYLAIISKPTSFTVTSVNPVTGEKVNKKVTIKSTLSASNINTFTYLTPTFKVKLLDKNTGKAIANKNIQITANGATKTVKTDSNGVASLSLKYTSKGTYKITTKDPNTGYVQTNYAYVKWATLTASSMTVREKTSQTFIVKLTDQNRKTVANANVQITINGVTKTAKTDSNGLARMTYKLDAGTYYFTTKDPSTGYVLKTKIYVKESNSGKTYNKYGVSEDGKTILAIGRASASGELSTYGYTFYVTEFSRVCPYCHSTELYWSIFWAGSETANYGVFPATGNKEGGSAEGHIFCAHCDSDWSVFGHNHGGSGGNLKVVTPTASCTKADAYALKNGNYVYP